MPSTELSPSLDRTPMSIGRYNIVCKLGSGGMADVYLAHQPGPFSAGKLLVIKHLKPGIASDAQFVEMFADESRLAVRLSHPNVVHTYEVVVEDNNYYLTLEYLDGQNFRQILQKCQAHMVPLELQIWIFIQLLSGLHYAHELADFDGSPMGIVHRDVSPANVFITYTGEVKLLDFGIAKSLGAISATREGIVKGKLGYASPEQCLCRPVDRRTDLYSVGVMLWEGIARRKRAMGETDASVYQARVQGLEPQIDDVCPDLPRDLVAICNKALVTRVEERFQTALEFRQALENYLSSVKSNAGREQLTRFMHKHFAHDIVAMQQRLSEHMGQLRGTSRDPVSTKSVAAEPSQAAELHQSSSIPFASLQGGKTQARIQTSFTPPGPGEFSYLTGASGLSRVAFAPAVPWYRQGTMWGTLGIGALSAAALTVWLVAPRAVGSQPPSETAQAADSQTMGRNPADRQSPAAEQVSITLSAAPSSAVLRLDGRRISNPYSAVHGADVNPHRVSVSLSGYETVEVDLVFDRDVSRSFQLVASGDGDEQPRSAHGSSRRWRAVRPVAPTVTEATKVEPPADIAARPGEDLRVTRPRPKSQNLDETDPYRQ